VRCPRLLAAALLVALAPAAQAGADGVRAEIASRLSASHPGIAPADYALGAAAFDAARRAKLEENTPAPGSAEILAEGKRLWTRKFRNGRSLAQCFPNGGRRIAAAYPQLDAKSKRVVTLDMAVNQCLKTHGEALLEAADPATMGAVLAYARSLSEGQKLAVRAAGPLGEERFEQGRRLYFTRMGQQNYACASCHVQNAGRFYGDAALPAAPGAAARWPFVREGRAITLQVQVRECLERMGAAPFPAGSEELAQVEYFLTVLSQGLPIKPNAWRPR
jgi:sulfur-oxidizing protein SoxA